MRMRWIIFAVVVLSPVLCLGQDKSTIPLGKANSSLAVPEMTERDGVLYVAYRTFDIFRRSDQLRVLAYDLSSHKELRHAMFSVPKVQGAGRRMAYPSRKMAICLPMSRYTIQP